jgi:hypothetical protein
MGQASSPYLARHSPFLKAHCLNSPNIGTYFSVPHASAFLRLAHHSPIS